MTTLCDEDYAYFSEPFVFARAGSAIAAGVGRGRTAARRAIAEARKSVDGLNPHAGLVLVHVEVGRDETLREVADALGVVQELLAADGNVLVETEVADYLGEGMRVTVLARDWEA